MDEQAFRDIGSAVEGITSQTTATGSFTTGGTFSYTPDQLRSIITRLTNLADSYAASRENATYMAIVEGPGLEYASQSHAAAARASGQAYLQSIDNERRSCLTLAQRFQDTLDDYLGLEHRTVERMNQAGPPDDQAGPISGI